MEDWFAKAAKEDVDSWYLHNPCAWVNKRKRACVSGFRLQSERFFVEALVVFDSVQSLFLKRSFDPMQNVVYVMLLRPEGTFNRRSASVFRVEAENACLQGLNRGERLKLPSFWDING